MSDLQGLAGRIALVTGANRGIGRAICDSLIKEGANLAITDLHLNEVQTRVEEIGISNERILAVELDVRDSSSVTSAVNQIIRQFGRIDILVNNAGINKISSFLEIEDGDFDEIIRVNLRGTYLVSKIVVPFMIKQGEGKIINVASQAGKVGEAYNSTYCASKFAVIGLTQSLARELGPYGISVYAICPGPVDTRLLRESIASFAKMLGRSPEDHLLHIIQQTAIGRLLYPEEVAAVVTSLVCSNSDAVTGASIQITGGATMW